MWLRLLHLGGRAPSPAPEDRPATTAIDARARSQSTIGRRALSAISVLRDAIADAGAGRVENADVANARRRAALRRHVDREERTRRPSAPARAASSTMNQRERTRSRYSRLATMKNFLSMAGHPRFDARGADALEEDLMERRLHQLEALDVRAGVDQPAQQHLRDRRSARAPARRSCCCRRPCCTSCAVAEHRADAVLRAAGRARARRSARRPSASRRRPCRRAPSRRAR